MHFRHFLPATFATVWFAIAMPSLLVAQAIPAPRGAISREALADPRTETPLPITNQKAFRIPVTVDRSQPGHVPVEVQLLVSADRGKTWSTYARQGVDGKDFPFQTRDDGEYWFASRTLDKAGVAKPSGAISPELKLMLDGTPPKIELDATFATNGQLKAAFKVTDDTLLADSVKLEYQSSEGAFAAWKETRFQTDDTASTASLQTGSAAFTPPATARAVVVRIQARDRAGNLQQEIREVAVPRVAQLSPTAPSWPPRYPVSTPNAIANSAPSSANDPFTARMAQATPPPTKMVDNSPTTQPNAESLPLTKWPLDNQLPASVAAKPLTPQTLDRAVSEVSPPVRDGVPALPSSNASPGLIFRPTESAPEQPPAVTTSPPPFESVSPTPVPAVGSSPRHDEIKPLLSASKNFALEYDLDAVGPQGVKSVELWVTADGGHTWRKWGEDADKRSPFEIQVESEQTFGFRMVISANNGLATRPPEPGDTADVWVRIDATVPTVRIMQAGYGSGEHAGQLDLRWQADDENLGSRPVTIVFSDSPQGPYTTLAAGLPNTGQYYWTIDPRTPRQLYLRIEVRDEAGNLAADQTAEPVSLEGLAPKGRIRSVAPAHAAPERGAFKTPLFR